MSREAHLLVVVVIVGQELVVLPSTVQLVLLCVFVAEVVVGGLLLEVEAVVLVFSDELKEVEVLASPVLELRGKVKINLGTTRSDT